MSSNRMDKKTESSLNTSSRRQGSIKSSSMLPDLRTAKRPSPINTNLLNTVSHGQQSELGTARSRQVGVSDRAQMYIRDKSSEIGTATSRNLAVVQKTTFQSKRSSHAGTGTDSMMKNHTANSAQFKVSKTPQRHHKDGQLPTLVSGATRRSQAMYKQNYVLDIDSNVYSSRQNVQRIGNFYNSVVRKHIFRTNQPSPLLSPEKKAIMESFRRAALSQRKVAESAHTVDHDDFNDRLQNAESMLDKEMGHDILFPRMVHVMSQDQLMVDHHQKLLGKADLSKLNRGELSTALRGELSTDNRQTAIDTREPQSKASPFDGERNQLSMAESMLQQSQQLDPVAGNSVVTQLNQSVQIHAKKSIHGMIEDNMSLRSRERRRRELVGYEQQEKKESEEEREPFHQIGELEANELDSDLGSAANQTKTSLADSSVYNILVDNMDAANAFIEKRKKEKELMEKSMGKSMALSNHRTLNIDAQQNLKAMQEELLEMKERREDPEAHFKKLKAKIKLKVVKQYQEDLVRQKLEEKQAQQPVVEIKDKWGRVISKESVLNINQNKKPSKNRKPVKRKPPVRRQSFTEMQLKYPRDNIYNPMDNYPKPSLTDKYVIDMMKEADRFPIPEALVGRSKKQPFTLYIDSIMTSTFKLENVMKWAEEPVSQTVPNNSMESEDDFQIYKSEDSEEMDVFPYIPKAKLEADPSLREKQFDVKLLQSSPYRMESMQYYPYRRTEGNIPRKLLKTNDTEYLFTCQDKITEQQSKEQWSHKLIQNIFEHFCIEMKAAPLILSQFYNYDDPNNPKISIKNYQMDEQTVKAFVLILPHMIEFNELELQNNQITDNVSACIVFSTFCNPSLKRLTVAYNYMGQQFVSCLQYLIQKRPEKLTDINVMGSILYADHIEPLVRVLPSLKTLNVLNIAGCQLTQGSCRLLRDFMIACPSLRTLDVSHCRINYQSTRYIIDALNRNTCIRTFNFSHNDLTSATFEFSIKVASIITRHSSLMHIDITNTNLKREEILFIGLSIPISKTLLSCHLTAQKLPYYERIFLRAAIAARVGFQYRNATQRRKIQSNKERNQILQMAAGEVQDQQMKYYTEKIKLLDEKREGLEIEITDMLAEMDTEASFNGLDPETQVKQLGPDTQIGRLVDKLVQRQRELDAQQKALEEEYLRQKIRIKEDMQQRTEFQDLSMELQEIYGAENQARVHQYEESVGDYFEKMKELRVERQRIKAEIEVTKEAKDRSAGELALMFMGINQVAYDLLVENPMTGYMNEIIFSRVLGHDEIEEGTFWVDTVQCWVCQKWNKVIFTFDEADKEIFHQQTEKLGQLQEKINYCVQHNLNYLRDQDFMQKNSLDYELQSIQSENDVDNGKIEEVSEKFEATGHGSKFNFKSSSALGGSLPFGQGSSTQVNQETHGLTANTKSAGSQYQYTKNVTISDDGGPRSALKETQGTGASGNNADVKSQSAHQETILEEPVYAEAEDENFVVDEANLGLDNVTEQIQSLAMVNPVNEFFDTSNILSPVKTTKEMVKRIVTNPENFEQREDIIYKVPTAEEMYGNEQRRLEALKEINKHSKNIAAIRNGPLIAGLDKNKVTVTPIYRHTDPMMLGMDRSPTHSMASAHENQRQFIGSKDDHSSTFGETGVHSSVISHTETKRRKHGEPVIIQRRIIFDGVVYQIDEELYSDSDHSSVYTSEDDFVEDKNLPSRFKRANPLANDKSELEDGALSQTVDDGTGTNSPKPTVTIKRMGTQFDGQGRATPIDAKTADVMQKTGSDFGVPENLINVSQLESESIEPKSEIQKIKVDDPAVSIISKSKDEENDLLKVPDKGGKKSVRSTNPNRDRQALAAEFFSNSPGLTQAQKEYESKITPKHYKPLSALRRLNHFLTKLGREPKNKDNSEVYCCASFNDWLPMRMKTQLTLKLERYPMDFPAEEIPSHVFSLNDEQKMCASMVPPGQHFFYFVREKGNIFLSPKHEVVRFKSTNIFLNRVKVSKRLDDLEAVHQAKDGEEDEAVFMKDRSIFKDYRENTEAFLQKMFDEDIQFGKISRTINKKEDFEAEFTSIKNILFTHYQDILNIFDYYSGTSNYPTISMNDFTSFSNQCQILDQKYINLAALDLLLVATCVSINQYVNSAEKDLQRYEFVEMIVRLAIFRYKEPGLVKSTAEGIERVLEDLIYPNAQRMDGDDFRRRYCYNVKTNKILEANEPVIRKIYDSYTHAKKKWIVLDECKSFVRKVGLKISEQMVGAIYAESMMSIIDTIRDQSKPQQMRFVEFIVFICRISHQHYSKTKYKDELLYLKLEHLIPKYLEQFGLNPVFLFGEKFKIDQAKEDARQKNKMKKLQDQLRRQRATGEQVDPKLLSEVQAYQEAKGGTFRLQEIETMVFSDAEADPELESQFAMSKRGSEKAYSAHGGSGGYRAQTAAGQMQMMLDLPDVGRQSKQNMDLVSDLASQAPINTTVMINTGGDQRSEIDVHKSQPEIPGQGILMGINSIDGQSQSINAKTNSSQKRSVILDPTTIAKDA